MLRETRPGELAATCEDCEETSPSFQKELAVLRLMRAGWRVRTTNGLTRTWCHECHPLCSVPRLRID